MLLLLLLTLLLLQLNHFTIKIFCPTSDILSDSWHSVGFLIFCQIPDILSDSWYFVKLMTFCPILHFPFIMGAHSKNTLFCPCYKAQTYNTHNHTSIYSHIYIAPHGLDYWPYLRPNRHDPFDSALMGSRPWLCIVGNQWQCTLYQTV